MCESKKEKEKRERERERWKAEERRDLQLSAREGARE
jgi:hypothetical protein